MYMPCGVKMHIAKELNVKPYIPIFNYTHIHTYIQWITHTHTRYNYFPSDWVDSQGINLTFIIAQWIKSTLLCRFDVKRKMTHKYTIIAILILYGTTWRFFCQSPSLLLHSTYKRQVQNVTLVHNTLFGCYCQLKMKCGQGSGDPNQISDIQLSCKFSICLHLILKRIKA